MPSQFNQYDMTEKQQKRFSGYCNAVSKAQEHLDKQLELAASKPLTFVMERLDTKLKTANKKLENEKNTLNNEVRRYEAYITKLESDIEQTRNKIQQLKSSWETRQQELETTIAECEKKLDEVPEPPNVVQARINLKFAQQAKYDYMKEIDPLFDIPVLDYQPPSQPLTVPSVDARKEAERAFIKRQMEAEDRRMEEESRKLQQEAKRLIAERLRKEEEQRLRDKEIYEANRLAQLQADLKRQDEARKKEIASGVERLINPPLTPAQQQRLKEDEQDKAVASAFNFLTQGEDDGWDSELEREGLLREQQAKAAREAKKVAFAPPPSAPPPSRPKKCVKRVMIKEVAPGISTYPVPLTED